MPFKIVQTIEKGAKYLTVVPSKWENGGVCYFPRRGLTEKQTVENSVPEKDFLQYQSILKRDNLQSFNEANAILDIILQQSDTDNEDRDVSATKKVLIKKSANTIKNAGTIPDLNEYLNISQSSHVPAMDTTQQQQPITYQIVQQNEPIISTLNQPPKVLASENIQRQQTISYQVIEQHEPSTSTNSVNVSFFFEKWQS